MFERFTDRSRRVLRLAQEEARTCNHSFIGTEHLLLGLLHEGEGVAAQALGRLDITLEAAREKVEEIVGRPEMAPSSAAPFTPRAKKVLELALREALQLGHSYIGTEHLLLGIVREGEGVGTQVLVSLGADPSLVREQVLEVLSDDPGAGEPAHWRSASSARLGAYEGRGPRVGPLAARVASGGVTRGARCATCGADLAGTARYQILDVAPAPEEDTRAMLQMVVVHCSACGAALAATLPRHAGSEPAPPSATLQVSVDHGALDGMIGPEALRLELGDKTHQMTVRGAVAGREVEMVVRIDDNAGGSRPLHATGDGHVGTESISLRFEYDLQPSFLFDKGRLTGDLGAVSLDLVVRRVAGPSTSSIEVTGSAGSDAVQLSATVSGDHHEAQLYGRIGMRAVKLFARRSPGDRAAQVIGTWAAPVELGALGIGALTYFL